MATVETFDFHVTSECSQECAYCWGPQGIDAVDTGTAFAIIDKLEPQTEAIELEPLDSVISDTTRIA